MKNKKEIVSAPVELSADELDVVLGGSSSTVWMVADAEGTIDEDATIRKIREHNSRFNQQSDQYALGGLGNPDRFKF
jgi:hypothetical protein